MTLALLGLLLCAACRTGIVYVGDDVRVYYGGPDAAPAEQAHVDTVRIITFNIKYAVQTQRALELLQSNDDLRMADVLLLQEMDEEGTWRLAEALGMHYVYYPAVRHTRTGRDFGNAVLSHWPIVAHERILLPHTARFTRTRRTATAATLQVGDRQLRVYSVHLATILEAGPRTRAQQLCAVVDDALGYDHAIVGGDLNSSTVAEAAERMGLQWPTATVGWTALGGTLDHILLHDMGMTRRGAGVVRDVRGASDHRPVWIEVAFPR
jgi:endonuclease/exonuclease/phosphatase family metal-dependent hydrolase